MDAFHGNRKVPLGDLFDVEGDPDDEVHRWEGDLSGVHWVGAKMKSGTIHLEGNGGRHIGSEMQGGEIIVDGNAGDWVGGEMTGGVIRVHGNAGQQVGAAYRGSLLGMRGGRILIEAACRALAREI